MGNRRYAHSIMEFMKKEIPTFDEMNKTKVISRDDGHDHTEGKIIKTLRQLSPTDQSFFVILDDRGDVWPEAQRNLLQVYPYVYFKHRDESMLKVYPHYFKYFTKEDFDPFLLYYGLYLKTIHDKYYDILETSNPNVDLRDVHMDTYNTLFAGLK